MADRTCPVTFPNGTICARPCLDMQTFCPDHQVRFIQHGDPLGGGTRHGELMGFFTAHVLESTPGCRFWPYNRDSNGYPLLCVSGKMKRVTRLTCERWYGPPPAPKLDACHSCRGAKLGCWAGEHLSWGSRFKNVQDMIRDGTAIRGERSLSSRLTEEQVREIRRSAALQPLNQRILGEVYGVSSRTINDVILRRTWKHLS